MRLSYTWHRDIYGGHYALRAGLTSHGDIARDAWDRAQDSANGLRHLGMLDRDPSPLEKAQLLQAAVRLMQTLHQMAAQTDADRDTDLTGLLLESQEALASHGREAISQLGEHRLERGIMADPDTGADIRAVDSPADDPDREPGPISDPFAPDPADPPRFAPGQRVSLDAHPAVADRTPWLGYGEVVDVRRINGRHLYAVQLDDEDDAVEHAYEERLHEREDLRSEPLSVSSETALAIEAVQRIVALHELHPVQVQDIRGAAPCPITPAQIMASCSPEYVVQLTPLAEQVCVARTGRLGFAEDREFVTFPAAPSDPGGLTEWEAGIADALVPVVSRHLDALAKASDGTIGH